MKIVYGTYEHQENEAFCSMQIAPRFSPQGRRIGRTRTAIVRGAIIGTSQSDLTTKINALEDAYSESSLFVLKDNSNADTPHKIDPADTISGTKCRVRWVGPTTETNSGIEYATRRSYEISIVGETFEDIAGNGLWSFTEEISVVGGSYPAVIALEPAQGAAILQEPTEQTARRILQKGSAVGLNTYPAAPSPAFSRVDGRRSGSTNSSPQIIGTSGNFMFGTAWEYVGFLEAADSVPTPSTG